MRAFSDVVYPAVLLAMVAVFAAGAVAYLATARTTQAAGSVSPGLETPSRARLARLLIVAMWVARAATGIEIVAIGALLGAGVTHPPMVMLVGYLVAAVAVLALLGISRLAAPPAPGQLRGASSPHDADRPVLGPRQAIQVDAAAAMLVAVALAVVAWRLNAIVLAG